MKYLTTLALLLIAKLLFSQENLSINEQLLIAADSGQFAKVEQLMKAGGDVNTSTEEGVTPLMYAALKGHSEIVRELLANGALLEKTTYDGASALILAASENQLQTAEILLAAGAYTEATDAEGNTALVYAIAYNYKEMVQLLLRIGASTETPMYGNATPLMLACYDNNFQMVQILLTAEANINVTDDKKYTPLMYAVQENAIEITSLLLGKGAETDNINIYGTTALGIAVYYGFEEITQLLLQFAADVNLGENQNTPLVLALVKRNPQIKKSLLEAGAVRTKNLIWNYCTISQVFTAANKDFFLGNEFSRNELKWNFNYTIGFYYRPYRKPILYQEREHFFYQFNEWRSLFYFGLEKRFLQSYHNNNTFGFFGGAKACFTISDFKGTEKKARNNFLASPTLGFFMETNKMVVKCMYEYFPFQLQPDTQNYFSINFAFKFNKLYKYHSRNILFD